MSRTKKPSPFSRLHARFAENIRRQALADLVANRSAREPANLLAAKALSVAILSLPPILGLGGLVLVVAGFPNILLVLFGAMFLVFAWMVRPRPAKLPERVVTAEEAPKLFALLSEVAGAMQAPTPDGVVLFADFNAWVGFFGPERRQKLILGLGVPLWKLLTPSERLALLGHEFGHLVNGDPARRGVIGRALEVLHRWHDLWAGEEMFIAGTGEARHLHQRTFIEVIFTGVGEAITGSLIALLTRLFYAESQRAEYLADALAARTAGSDAAVATLHATILAPLGAAALNGAFVQPNTKTDLIGKMVTAIREADAKARAALLAAAEAEGVAVDGTHPPTRQRLRFLSELSIEKGLISMSQARTDAIDRELAGEFDRIEVDLRRMVASQ